MSEKEIKDLKSLYEKGLISKEAYEEAVSKLENKDSATEIHQLKKELEDLKKKRKELKENKISNEDSQTTKNSDNSLSNSSTLKNLLVKNQTIIGIALVVLIVFLIQNSDTQEIEDISIEENLPWELLLTRKMRKLEQAQDFLLVMMATF